MSRLDQLGHALRAEQGTPPRDWVQRQGRRLRSAQNAPTPRIHSAWAPLFACVAMAAMAAAGWLTLSPPRLPAADGLPSAADISLQAEDLQEPYRLDDGSSIDLEAGARGRLAHSPTATQFDLQRGLARFEVTKRHDQRWTVVAGQYEVRVVGTRFSVSYESPDRLSVVVERGVVEVKLPEATAPIQLVAGDRLDATQAQVAVEHAEPSGEPALTPSPAPPTDDLAPAATSGVTKTNDAARDWHALYAAGKYSVAFAAAERAGLGELTRRLDAGKLADLADTARLSGHPEPALRALKALEERFPRTQRAADAGFLIGRIHATRGETDAAISRFNAYLSRGDRARYSLEAMGRLIELHSKRGNTHDATAMAERYLQRAPHGPYWRLARSILQGHK